MDPTLLTAATEPGQSNWNSTDPKQTITPPPGPIRAAARCLFLPGCLLWLVGLTGCQNGFPAYSSASLPVPPATLDTEKMETVRYQSPDDRTGDRVQSRNRMAISNLPLQDLATRPSDEGTDGTDASQRVAKLVIKGNRNVSEQAIRGRMRTRVGRFFDPAQLQQDVAALWQMSQISRVKGPFLERTPEGVIITLEITERPVITEVQFIGNRGIADYKLKQETGLDDGKPLDVHQIRMAKTRLEEFYREKGYPRTQVEIAEGSDSGDSKVVFLIHEDEKQRIWKVEFEGNEIASDGRLKSFIESKPGILKLFGGLVKRDEIEQDITRLTSYYRSLGFFNARIGREIEESNDGRWLTLRFIINEGPRYRVRNVAFVGNQAYTSEQLESMLELKPGLVDSTPEFNVATMNRDVAELRQLYGGQGFVLAEIQAEPRFLEEPGLLDLVYRIEEGQQYVVGDINVHYVGGNAITKREAVLNRMSLRPGDLCDLTEIRNSERRLGASQIFTVGGPGGGAPPRIVVNTPELKELQRMASGPNAGSQFR